MLTDTDIYFSEEDMQSLLDDAVSGQAIINDALAFFINDVMVHYMHCTPMFKTLVYTALTVECVNDDCSTVRFLDRDGIELETLSTTSKFGSILSSKPVIRLLQRHVNKP
jgi:hypothetical protein